MARTLVQSFPSMSMRARAVPDKVLDIILWPFVNNREQVDLTDDLDDDVSEPDTVNDDDEMEIIEKRVVAMRLLALVILSDTNLQMLIANVGPFR